MGAQHGPDETAKFPGHSDLGLVALKSASQQADKAVVQTILSLPAQGPNGFRLALLATGKFFADFGRDSVVLGTFGQQPPLMGIAATGDAAQALVRAAGGLCGNQAKIGHELARMSKAVDVAQFANGDHGGDQLEAAEGHESLHRGFESPGFQESEHGAFNALDSSMSGINALKVFFQDGFHCRMGKDQFTQIAHVGLAPIGFALITETVAQEKTFEPMTATAMIIDRIGASATKVTNGFVRRFGDVDGGQFTGAQQAGQAAGIPFISFEGRARLFGDEGRSGDQAGNFELLETAGDAKAAGAGFIGDLEDGAWMSFADAVESFLQSLQVVGDGAEDANLAVATGFGDSDDDGVFMDIETDIECNVFHGVVVSLCSLDESERNPAHSEDVLAALPIQATRVIMNGNHTTFFNPEGEDAVRAVSHKV